MKTDKQFKNLLLVAVVSVFLAACSPKLQTILLEDKNGNTELVYAGTPSPDNLVKEIIYYPSGDTLSITPMLKGAVNGSVKKFNEGNLLKEVVTFKKGEQTGIYQRFDDEGILTFEGKLDKGLKTGVWTTWYDDVQIQETRTYANDLAEGKWSYYYIDGSLKREEIYKNGKLIEEKNF